MQRTSSQSNKTQRKGDLDFLRIIAIIAVVIIHCIATVVIVRSVDSSAWMAGNLIDSFMRWSVPVFVMISGALVIKKQTFTEQSTFYKKRFARILIPLTIWPIIYILWSVVVFNGEFSIKQIINGYLLGAPIVGFHLYFLFLIAGLYVLTPIISMYTSLVTRRQLWITTIIILAATITWATIEYLLPNQNQSLNMITRGLPYVGYFILGYLLRDMVVKRTFIPIATFAIGSLLIAIASYYMVSSLGINKGLFFYAYPTILVMIVSPAAFLSGRIIYEKISASLTSRVLQNKFDSILYRLSSAAFGVYLVHVIVLQAFIRFSPLESESLKSALLSVPLVLITSWIIILLLLRVPYVKSLVK